MSLTAEPPAIIVERIAPPDAPPRLSICLPTVLSRCDLFAILRAEVERQSSGKPVEILVACDSKEISIGKKRQNLLEQATGDYVVYIDDDDWISTTYVDQILAALTTSPDCVGFLIECTRDGRNKQRAIASLKYKQWAEHRDGYAHCRSPYQKTPIRRTLALQAGFPDLRYGEDRIFSTRVTPLLKTEVFVNAILYIYRYREEPFHTKYGIQAPASQQSGGRPRGPVYDYKGRRVG